MTDILAEDKYGKKKKYTAPDASTQKHSHFDRKALSQALTPIQTADLKQMSHEESIKTNNYEIQKDDSFDSMAFFLNEIMNEGVAEYRATKYSKAEEEIIISRATSTVIERHNCGVLKCLNYYKNFLSFVKCGKMWLKFSEFESIQMRCHEESNYPDQLTNNGWLDIEVVEYYLKLMIPVLKNEHNISQSISLLSLRNTQHLFYDIKMYNQLSEKARQKYNDRSSNYLIIPVLAPGHYFLIIIDNQQQIFYYLDSGPNNGNERTARTLKNRYVDRTSSKLKLKVVAVKVQSQDDVTSCGIFVIHFAISFVKSLGTGVTSITDIPLIGDKMQKREEIMQNILNFSDNITEICPKCYKTAHNSVTCLFCKRNMHNECVNISVGTLIANRVEEPRSSSIICFECSNFLLNSKFRF